MKYISILVLIATTVCIVTATVDSTYDYFPLVQVKSNSSTSIPDIEDKCSKETHVIHSKFDLQHLDDCETIEGNVFVTGFKDPIIQFGSKIHSISGSLSIRNAPNLVRVEALGIKHIGDSFSLKELTSLALLSFPSLKSANSLDWKVLPILSTVHFGDSLNVAQNIVISDTSLTSFSGFIANDLKTLDINNNRFLESITATVENITESLHIASNSENLNVNLSSLKFANNLTIHEASKLELSNLENVENSASFLNNNFKQLKLPKLKGIGGTLRVSKNPNLSQIELPQVDEIGGGLVVINNTNIEKINFLPNLSIIGGAIELMGNIKEIQLKSLKLVKGSARIKSLTSSFDCSKWTTSEIGSTIRGSRIECTNSDDVKFVTEQNSNSDEDTQSPFDDYSENGENDGERGLASKYFKSESGSTMFIASKWILLFTTSINYLILYNL